MNGEDMLYREMLKSKFHRATSVAHPGEPLARETGPASRWGHGVAHADGSVLSPGERR